MGSSTVMFVAAGEGQLRRQRRLTAIFEVMRLGGAVLKNRLASSGVSVLCFFLVDFVFVLSLFLLR